VQHLVWETQYRTDRLHCMHLSLTCCIKWKWTSRESSISFVVGKDDGREREEQSWAYLQKPPSIWSEESWRKLGFVALRVRVTEAKENVVGWRRYKKKTDGACLLLRPFLGRPKHDLGPEYSIAILHGPLWKNSAPLPMFRPIDLGQRLYKCIAVGEPLVPLARDWPLQREISSPMTHDPLTCVSDRITASQANSYARASTPTRSVRARASTCMWTNAVTRASTVPFHRASTDSFTMHGPREYVLSQRFTHR
jgi:hypothetical protein